MKYQKAVSLIVALITSAAAACADSGYDISGFYEFVKAASGTKAAGQYDQSVEIKYILTPTKACKGKYIVEVKKIGDNLYQIKDTDICFVTRYCHERASFSGKVVLIVESNYGYNKGKIIFD